MSLHSLLDGLALGTAVQVEARATVRWVGLGTALAVILHKPFDALTVLTLMRAGGCGAGLRRAVNVGFALIAPLGAVLSFVGLGALVRTHHEILGCALAFCAGSFLCIAGSDLLPELQFHSHDRIRLSLALLAGLAVSLLIGLLEGEGHGHGQHHHHAATHWHRAYPIPDFFPGTREEGNGA
jgi:zinc and cadmium transporter